MPSPRLLGPVVISVLALSGCSSAFADQVSSSSSSSTSTSTSQRTVQVTASFSSSPGTATTYDTALVPAGARVAVDSVSGPDGTTVTLEVRGLDDGRGYGAHVHTEPCGVDGAAAGPHFQDVVDPVQPSVDPAYANPDNEIWLDLLTDEQGAGAATASVPWGFSRDRRPGSVVLHAMPTATAPGEAGSAGARAACVTVDF